MGKRKDTGNYAGDPTKAKFRVFKQKAPTSCGAACLRMIEKWTTRSDSGEASWCTAAGMGANGIFMPGMRRALGQLPLDVKRLAPSDIDGWRKGSSDPQIDSSSVYLLTTDTYGADGRNAGHWIILLDLFDSIETTRGRRARRLARYADPLIMEPVVWPWTSLLDAGIHKGFRLTQKPQ